MRIKALAASLLVLAACGGGDPGSAPAASDSSAETTMADLDTTTTEPAVAAPETTTSGHDEGAVEVEAGNGTVTLPGPAEQVVSLSPTATEMLFAVGAGDQVVAVDDQSDHPSEAPVTDLSGFTPNVEAIVEYEPDLVVVAQDIDGIVGALEAVDVPVAVLPAVVDLDGTYAQIESVGALTGRSEEAAALVEEMEEEVAEIVGAVPDLAEAPTYYHELDPTLFSVTSQTFIGHVYGLAGLENIADAADEDGSGYPQLTAEYVIEADPDLIFLADADCCDVTPESLAQRPGWGSLTAVAEGHVHAVDEDIASRWGPRVVDFLRVATEAVAGLAEES